MNRTIVYLNGHVNIHDIEKIILEDNPNAKSVHSFVENKGGIESCLIDIFNMNKVPRIAFWYYVPVGKGFTRITTTYRKSVGMPFLQQLVKYYGGIYIPNENQDVYEKYQGVLSKDINTDDCDIILNIESSERRCNSPITNISLAAFDKKSAVVRGCVNQWINHASKDELKNKKNWKDFVDSYLVPSENYTVTEKEALHRLNEYLTNYLKNHTTIWVGHADDKEILQRKMKHYSIKCEAIESVNVMDYETVMEMAAQRICVKDGKTLSHLLTNKKNSIYGPIGHKINTIKDAYDIINCVKA